MKLYLHQYYHLHTIRKLHAFVSVRLICWLYLAMAVGQRMHTILRAKSISRGIWLGTFDWIGPMRQRCSTCFMSIDIHLMGPSSCGWQVSMFLLSHISTLDRNPDCWSCSIRKMQNALWYSPGGDFFNRLTVASYHSHNWITVLAADFVVVNWLHFAASPYIVIALTAREGPPLVKDSLPELSSGQWQAAWLCCPFKYICITLIVIYWWSFSNCSCVLWALMLI